MFARLIYRSLPLAGLLLAAVSTAFCASGGYGAWDRDAGNRQDSTAQTGYAQITMDNQTSVTLDLYIDDVYAGRALAGLFCTSQLTAGSHTLEARAGDGRTVSREITTEEGESVTWTVGEE